MTHNANVNALATYNDVYRRRTRLCAGATTSGLLIAPAVSGFVKVKILYTIPASMHNYHFKRDSTLDLPREVELMNHPSRRSMLACSIVLVLMGCGKNDRSSSQTEATTAPKAVTSLSNSVAAANRPTQPPPNRATENPPAPPPALLTSIRKNFPEFRVPAAADLTGQWAQSGRAGVPPFISQGDFNGDGLTDAAVILIGHNLWRFVVFEQTSGGAYFPAYVARPKLRTELPKVGKDGEGTSIEAPQEMIVKTLVKGQVWAPEGGDQPYQVKLPVDGIVVEHFKKLRYAELDEATLVRLQDGQFTQDNSLELLVPIERQKGCGTVSSSFEGTTCLQASFEGEVSADHLFEKQFGELVFRLNPAGAQSGWIIEVAPRSKMPKSNSSPDVDYVWVVNPPYRGRNTRYLDTSYGVTIKHLLESSPYDFNFVVDQQGYDEASVLVEKATMSRPPGDHTSAEDIARESDEATDRLLTRLPVSKGRLVILDSRIATAREAANDASIEWLKFRVSLRVPCSLDAPSEVRGISVDRTGCSPPSRTGKPN
jgi:hypothetical protein